jgi:hypothetical protein
LKTRLQSSEGDEMRQHVTAYEQVPAALGESLPLRARA